MFDEDAVESGKFASPDNSNDCKNEVEEDHEDGEIVDEDDVEVTESTEEITVYKLSKENHSGESANDKDIEPLWEMKQRHQTISHDSPNKPFVEFNSRSRGERSARNTRIILKQDVGYLMDDDKQRRKKRKYDQIDEKEPNRMLKNNQNIDFDQITKSDDIVRLLNSMKSQPGKSTKDQQSPFHLPPLDNYESEEIVQEKKSIIEESSSNDTIAMELGKTELPFRFPVAVAKEIDASLDSHPPIKYLLTPTEVSGTDYSNILPTMGIDDPRLRRSIAAARNPFFTQTVTATTVTSVRPVALKKSTPTNPRKPQQDVSTCASTVCALQQRPKDKDKRHLRPPIMRSQMMAVRDDPLRKPMVPKQKLQFGVDRRMNYF